MKKDIKVVPYNPAWPKIFEHEAQKIRQALGANCLAMHHVGSTSVPGLAAKPVIDMICVIKDPIAVIQPLESIGFRYKGEYNIPMRLYFNQTGGVQANLHVYEEGHPEIELNLMMRDYLREHPEVRDAYARLKAELLQDSASYERQNSLFTGYNLGKDEFIRKILKAAKFDRIRIMKCLHYAEWETAKRFRQHYFFDPNGIADPYTWTFDHKDHLHLVLYQGVDIIGYAHIQLWPEQRAAIRIMVIDEPYQSRGFGRQFLALVEPWLKRQGIQSIHVESRPSAQQFYQQCGYVKMPFGDPEGASEHSVDIEMGKKL